MKRITVVITLLLLATVSFAQKMEGKDVPSAVKSAFQKHYSKAKEVKWDKEEENFEASFDLNKINNSVLFDAQGNIIETETEIGVNQLPKAILDYVATKHKGQKIKEAAKITDAKGVLTYEAEIKEMDLIFDEKGNFIKEIKN